MQNGRGWADRRLSIVRRGGGERALPPPPPLENEKKEAVRGNFNLFHLCFTNEIRGRGAKQGGGLGGSQPPLNLDGGVEHLSTPPDFEKKNLGGVGSP